ncbi:hypothetical protein BKM70_14965 [Listeria monocytogenes]|nr:hypothetical protein BKM70_14965 [Listeria monocytogenes]
MKDYAIWKPAVVGFLLLTLMCGVVYPGIVTIFASAAFPRQSKWQYNRRKTSRWYEPEKLVLAEIGQNVY